MSDAAAVLLLPRVRGRQRERMLARRGRGRTAPSVTLRVTAPPHAGEQKGVPC
jgi:hypothetical protein